MGGTNWNSAAYSDRERTAKTSRSAGFDYHANLEATGQALVVHPILDPKSVNSRGLNAGKNIRESLDSEAHPESLAIAVIVDVTGSQRKVPPIIRGGLGKLQGMLVRRGIVAHPHILFGAVGDATWKDKVPLQIGQFEAGNEMYDQLTKMVLEGHGGDGQHESYALAAYFMAHHTQLDCLDKRKQKGFLFITGDEPCYDTAPKAEVLKLIGDDIKNDMTTKEIFTALQKKFNVFFIVPNNTARWGDQAMRDKWRDLVGERIINLEDPAAICESIVAAIALTLGKANVDDVVEQLKAGGATDAAAKSGAKSVAGVVTAPVEVEA